MFLKAARSKCPFTISKTLKVTSPTPPPQPQRKKHQCHANCFIRSRPLFIGCECEREKVLRSASVAPFHPYAIPAAFSGNDCSAHSDTCTTSKQGTFAFAAKKSKHNACTAWTKSSNPCASEDKSQHTCRRAQVEKPMRHLPFLWLQTIRQSL